MGDIGHLFGTDSDFETLKNDYYKNYKNLDNIYYAEKYIDALYELVLEEEIDIELVLPEMEKASKSFPFSELIAEAYSYTLIPYDLPKEIATKQANKIAKIHREFPNSEEIADNYLGALFCLTDTQSAHEIANSVAIGKLLSESYPNNEEIAFSYRLLREEFEEKIKD